MTRKISAGDQVICRLYNTPERKHYGQQWMGRVLEVDHDHKTGTTKTPFRVTKFTADLTTTFDIWLKSNEIIKIIRRLP